jgi:tetratricopeptide (TPR) repeat protein
MSDVTIDLSGVHSHLNNIQSNLQVVNSNLEVVHSRVEMVHDRVEFVIGETKLTKDRLDLLHSEFLEFLAANRKDKARQYAATELVRVQQEIEQKFGHHDIVRRTTTGILQATDVQVIRQNTMHTVTEQLMITTPSYWLAPALVALSAWIKDDRSLAERASAEAIHRDDNKTSLFFSLICRRARRTEAATRWLGRYFQMQNPLAIDREVVVMLDGLANGVFGGSALTTCSNIIEQWLEELAEQAGFIDEQIKRWGAHLDVMAPKPKDTDYPTLRQYSPTAPLLLTSLCAARRNQVIFDFFSTLFTGELPVPPTIESAVDSLLDSLVSNFDDEELPLRREKRMLELIKLEEGDEDAARKRYAAEVEIYEEKTSFAALLTSSGIHPEQLGATRATQRYAVSRSRQWILGAHADLVARDRMQVPQNVELAIASWKGTSTDGSNESALAKDLRGHYDGRIDAAVAAVKLSPGAWIVLIAGVLLGLLIMFQGGGAILFGLIIALAAAAFFYWKYKDLDRARTQVRQALEKEHDQAARVLKACLAELADYRHEVAVEDSRSEAVTNLLNALSSPQFVLQRREQRVSVA